MQQSRKRLQRLTVMAMLTALAFAAVAFIRIPVVLFLSYEPKDVFLTIGGFLFGPLAAAVMSLTVGLIEMVTISGTGAIGMAMNVLSSCLFACTASLLYHRKKDLKRAVIGLVVGAGVCTVGMLLWNFLVTPLYMHIPRAEIMQMLLPVFLPFNLLKCGLNAVLTTLLYKTVTTSLRKARLLPESASAQKPQRLATTLVASILLVALVMVLLVWRGII